MDKATRDLKYFMHYVKHTYFVVLAWKAISEELWQRNMLTEQEFKKTNNLIIWHDQSKMNKNEWDAYAKRFYGNQKDDETIIAFKEAVKEHKAKNLHHYESLKDYKGDVLAKSFDYRIPKWFKKNNPNIKRGLLLSDTNHCILRLLLCKPDFLAINKKCKINNFIKKYPILLWTIKDPKEFNNYENTTTNFICNNL